MFATLLQSITKIGMTYTPRILRHTDYSHYGDRMPGTLRPGAGSGAYMGFLWLFEIVQCFSFEI